MKNMVLYAAETWTSRKVCIQRESFVYNGDCYWESIGSNVDQTRKFWQWWMKTRSLINVRQRQKKMAGSCFKGRLLYAPFWNAEWRGGEVVEDRVIRYWTDVVQPWGICMHKEKSSGREVWRHWRSWPAE